MANAISLSRLPLLLLVVWMAYRPPGLWQVGATLVLVAVFVLDAVDGAVARRRGEESAFGAVLDIAIDRTVELGMWFVLVDLGAAPLWAALVFVVRGALVDALRASRLTDEGIRPFDAFEAPAARWIVAGRFMRGFYAAIKAITFCWLLFFLGAAGPLAHAWPEAWAVAAPAIDRVGAALVWVTVATCVLRGLPDLAEYPRRVIEGLRPPGLRATGTPPGRACADGDAGRTNAADGR